MASKSYSYLVGFRSYSYHKFGLIPATQKQLSHTVSATQFSTSHVLIGEPLGFVCVFVRID